MAELERLNADLILLKDEGHARDLEIAMLKVKASVWGAVGAMVPIALIVLLRLLFGAG